MNFKTFLKSLWGKRFELDGPKSALRYFYPDLWEKELNSPEIAASSHFAPCNLKKYSREDDRGWATAIENGKLRSRMENCDREWENRAREWKTAIED